MSEFSERTQIPISLADSLSGSFDVRNSGGTIGSFLDQIASKTQAVWWHDGIILHIEPARSIVSVYVDVEDVPRREIEQQIEDFGLAWDAFPLRFSADGTMVRIAGPESYVKQIKEVLERIVTIRRNRPERVRASVQPRLFLGGRGQVAAAAPPEPQAQTN